VALNIRVLCTQGPQDISHILLNFVQLYDCRRSINFKDGKMVDNRKHLSLTHKGAGEQNS